ncbi:MAG: cardiolipin synthase [Candidatus Cryptobacteroides sp.]
MKNTDAKIGDFYKIFHIFASVMLFNTILYVIFVLLILGAVIIIVSDSGDSGRKVAWLLVLTVLPLVGFILYICFGINWRHHWLFKRRHQRFTDALEQGADGKLRNKLFSDALFDRIDEKYHPLTRILSTDCLLAPSECGTLEIITHGNRKLKVLLEDIENAREFIHIEYYHFGADKSSRLVRDALMKKAREGVKVRFIYENIANFPISSIYYNRMKKAGVEIVKFTNPRLHLINLMTSINYRNHRKIVVIDGNIGYTGGMNINDHYFYKWRDTHLRITGSPVASLQYIFLDSWITAGGKLDKAFTEYFKTDGGRKADSEPDNPLLENVPMQIIADEPDGPYPVIQMGYVWALQNAREYFYIQTPYFMPPEPLLEALKAAALSGVDVRVMVPAKADNIIMRPGNKSFYDECVDAGVRIFERKGEFMHCKTFVSDDFLTSIGTANMDYRSFNINYEDNAYMYDRNTALLYKDVFLKDLESCREFTAEDSAAQPKLKVFWRKIVRLFAPLL